MKKFLSVLVLLSSIQLLNGMDTKPTTTKSTAVVVNPESVESQGWRMFVCWVLEHPHFVHDMARQWLIRVPWISKEQFIKHNTCFPKQMRTAIWHQICQLRLRNPYSNDLRIQVALLQNLLKNPANSCQLIQEFGAPCGIILIHGSSNAERKSLAEKLFYKAGIRLWQLPNAHDYPHMTDANRIEVLHKNDLYDRRNKIISWCRSIFVRDPQQSSFLLENIETLCPLQPKTVSEVEATISALEVLDYRKNLSEVVCATTSQPLCRLSQEIRSRVCCILSLHGFETDSI